MVILSSKIDDIESKVKSLTQDEEEYFILTNGRISSQILFRSSSIEIRKSMSDVNFIIFLEVLAIVNS